MYQIVLHKVHGLYNVEWVSCIWIRGSGSDLFQVTSLVQDLRLSSVKCTFQNSVTIPLSKHIYIQEDANLLISLSLFKVNGERHDRPVIMADL
jgi:hypothetical protein